MTRIPEGWNVIQPEIENSRTNKLNLNVLRDVWGVEENRIIPGDESNLTKYTFVFNKERTGFISIDMGGEDMAPSAIVESETHSTQIKDIIGVHFDIKTQEVVFKSRTFGKETVHKISQDGARMVHERISNADEIDYNGGL